MEEILKEWGQDPGLLVDLVLTKRLLMRREESPEEVFDIVPQPISFAPMAFLPLDEVPYVLSWGSLLVYEYWIMGVLYVPVVPVPASAPSDLEVRVYSHI